MRDRSAQRGQRHRADILPVDRDAAFLDLEKARDQVEDRRFAGPRGADQRHRAPGRDGQRHTVERHRAGAVAKAHLVEADFAARDPQRPRAGHVADRRLDIEHLKDPMRRGQPLLQRGIQIGQALQRLIGQQQRGHERKERARRARAGDDLMAAVEDDDGDRRAAQGLHHRRGARAGARRPVDQRDTTRSNSAAARRSSYASMP